MAYGISRGGAPGVFIYEDAIAAAAPVASFNTTYMEVAAPDETSVTVFPFNRPQIVTSLNEYVNLIGELPTVGGPALTSYYEVKAFFQQVTTGDLRVTRVGTPSNITEIQFNPAANKDDGVNAPSPLQRGDVVYIKAIVNGLKLGESNIQGAWLGVPVTIPVDYIEGDVTNNLQISAAMSEAFCDAIYTNADISAGTYIRQKGLGDPACDECAYVYLTGRIFNAPVELITSNEITGNQFIFARNAYVIQPVSESALTIYDWIQCTATAFNSPELPQGYLCAPAAFSIYDQQGRVNLGQTMEELCSDPSHKWMAVVDSGPFFVTQIEKYSEKKEADVADGFRPQREYLVENVIYRWTDTEPLLFTSANFDIVSAADSANAALADGSRRSLQDSRIIRINSALNATTNVITLADEWPLYAFKSGTLVTTSLFINDPPPIPPTYSDDESGAVAEELIGSFYVIAKDVDGSLADNQIKLATSRTRAIQDTSIDIITGGTPQGGGLLNLEYLEPAWSFTVKCKGKFSNVIEVDNNKGASFNTKHFPGTLQKPTDEFDFEALVRRQAVPNKSIFKGGTQGLYFGSQNVDLTADAVTIVNHGLNSGDEIQYNIVPSAAGPTELAALTTDNQATLFIIKVDDNVIQFASSLANAQAGTAIALTGAGTNSASVEGRAGQGVNSYLSIGGDLTFFVADHGLKTADRIYFDAAVTTASNVLVEASTDQIQTLYYVDRLDRNTFRLAPSSSDLAAGVFMDFPTSAITTSTPVDLYRALATAVFPAGEFNRNAIIRFIRGRKYQLDVTLAVFNVRDEANVGIQNGTDNPYGVAYTADLSTDFRLSSIRNPIGIKEFPVAAANLTNAANTITITAHGYVTGDAITLNSAFGATLATGITDNRTYFVNKVDANTIKIATTEANAQSGVTVAFSDDGVDNAAGVEFVVSKISNPYTYTYTEDSDSNPLNDARDFAGANNFYCVPTSTNPSYEAVYNQTSTNLADYVTYIPKSEVDTFNQANPGLMEVYGCCVLQEGTDHTTLYGASVECEFVEPSVEVPNLLFNFNAVTGREVIDEALRGVFNNGIPQAIAVEKGIDSHSRIFEESQKYSTTQGFLAFYAPYILTDLGVYIPPTGFVTGFALKRYRDEIAGFKLPPAGVKYALAGARGVQVEITTAMQDVSNPYGLNALRQLPGYSQTDPDTGITYGPVFIWGARTRINPANAEQALYKFVNTRVILNVIYGTLRRALDNEIFNVIDGRAVVFNQIRTIISNSLYANFYVPGALFGATAADAFDVIVDDRNNPPEALENGVVNAKVFVVPVPTLERIEIDLIRVAIGQIEETERQLGYI